MTQDNTTIGNAGEVFLRLLASRGVDYFFANPGTDFASICEALARARQEGFAVPRAVLVPHENIGVGMAYGVTMVTGRAQAVMVHVNVGTANAICGLINASRENIPMLMAAGRTPLYESGRHGARSQNIHWAQEMFDQSAMLREVVKWDYELRAGEQMESVVDRALAIARSEPKGPVYLSLPREVLAEAGVAPGSAAALQNPPAPPSPDPESIERAASILARAKNPLVITARAGSEPEAVPLLEALAERYALPVVEYRPRYLSISSAHPMHAGYEPGPWLDAADAILVLDCDVPWIPEAKSPAAGVPVIQVGTDPLFARYPARGFRGELSIASTSRRALAALGAALERAGVDPSLVAQRRSRIEAAGRARLRAGNVLWLLHVNADPAGQLFRIQPGRRTGLGPACGARGEAGRARAAGDRDARRRQLQLRQSAGLLSRRGDARHAGAHAGVEQRRLRRRRARHARDVSEGDRGQPGHTVGVARSAAALRRGHRRLRRTRRARRRGRGAARGARPGDPRGAR